MGSTSFDPLDCGEAVVNIPIVTPSVMLVLDKSGSMVADPGGFWDHDQDPATPTITRWNSLYSVVDLIVNNFNNSMNLGAVLFPAKTAAGSYTEAACTVGATADVAIGGMNAAKILGAIPGALTDATALKGGTPATKGLKVGISELGKAPAGQPKFMIFVTDGAANCKENAMDLTDLFENYDEQVAPTVAMALAMDIKTYVVGIDISQTVSNDTKDGNPNSVNTYEKLNEVAEAGGVARPGAEKFFNTTNQDELQAALQSISMQILSCTIELDPTPTYPDSVEVDGFREGLPVGPKDDQIPITDCKTQDGWMYLPKIDPNDPNELTRIELCGAACTDFQMSGMVDIQYRCPDQG
ncbi:MAG: VWA domain-containing protein [Nannocystis sp.]|nr:vWA domain-containing protein [Nannocystis sp.]MBA3549866.1 VWA domain-containing protein [Nannocystis sp.]